MRIFSEIPEGHWGIQARSLLGYVVVILLLGGTLFMGINRLDALTISEMNEIRDAELKVTLAERLRWSNTSEIAAGRGYLLSGDAGLLSEMRRSEELFSDLLQELKRSLELPYSHGLIVKVEQSADDYRRELNILVDKKDAGGDPAKLASDFDKRLRPIRLDVDRSLNQFAQFQSARTREVYRLAETDRARWVFGGRALTAALLMITLLIAWSFSSVVGRSYQKERIALETAEKAITARDDLLGMVAHDLRNPLTAILLQTEILASNLGNDTLRSRIINIEKSAEHMEHLIKSMLDVATIEAGKFTVVTERQEVERLLHEVSEMFENQARVKQINLEYEIAEPGLSVQADRERVFQVLSNLIGNALKFTPKGGRIGVKAAAQDECVLFEVTDSGSGIRPDQIPHIFDRFWKNKTSNPKGSGLGLFISEGIIKAHGGRIWAESEPGHGATIFFTLPKAIG
jgi:signal transduction histidine kinase